MKRALVLLTALMLAGCLQNTYSSDPNKRIVELVHDPEELRQIDLEVERFWLIDQPSHLTPARIHDGVSPANSPTTPPLPVSLAVANVHKEPVSLFTVHDGELRFLQTVAPGEAIDLPVSPSAKLAATFDGAPHCANYTVKGITGEVWLLRPAPVSPRAVLPRG
jgi:hypothetical protein